MPSFRSIVTMFVIGVAATVAVDKFGRKVGLR